MEQIESTLFKFQDTLAEIIEEHDTASLNIKIFGNLVSLLKTKKNGELLINMKDGIKRNSLDIQVVDPSGPEAMLCNLRELDYIPKVFLLSLPEFLEVLVTEEVAVGEVHVKNPHPRVKNHLAICQSCRKEGRYAEQLVDLKEERYAYQSLFTSHTAENYTAKLVPEGRIIYHARKECLVHAFVIPSATIKNHKLFA